MAALGSARDMAAPGVAAAALYLLLLGRLGHIARPDWTVIGASAALGFAGESFLVALGLVGFCAPYPFPDLAPAWIVALWAAFAATLPALRALLGTQPIAKAALLGGALGPVSYWAGARIGALNVAGPSGYAAIALLWALALPALIAFSASPAVFPRRAR